MFQETQQDLELLLKKYPEVFVKPEKLTQSITAANKSAKPAYTLCFKLILGVFSVEELANSRGQGLIKVKEGDYRPVLNQNKCAAIKGI